jgi:hypothetical protein
MAKAKPRPMRVDQKSQLAAMQRLETRSNEELESETKFKAAALAILGARAAEKYDAKTARSYFQRAIAASRPQERLQLRRMAEASLALAERRADDLKDAVTRLGQEPPSGRQLMALRFMGLIAPPPGANVFLKARGVLIILALIILILAIGFGIVELIALPFGGLAVGGAIVLGVLVAIVAIAVLAMWGRRRQAKARADRAAAGPG